MHIRTVLDLRPQKRKYLMQVMLLAASWHQNVRNTALLEILTIGRLPKNHSDFFAELGIKIREISPNRNDDFSKTSNAIEGTAPIPGEQILLVDNDVYFHRDISPLLELPANSFYGCQSNALRVLDAHWDIIRNELGYRPIKDPFLPTNIRVQALRNPAKASKIQQCVYVNGGVVLTPPDYDLYNNWPTHQRRIYEFFRDHPLQKGCVSDSNMAGLATCIGDYGSFSWLPLGYNYRWSAFILGLSELEEIKIVHMTGDPISDERFQHEGLDEERLTIRERIEHWWDSKINIVFDKVKDCIAPGEWERNKNISDQVRENAISLVAAYELDSKMKSLTAANEN